MAQDGVAMGVRRAKRRNAEMARIDLLASVLRLHYGQNVSSGNIAKQLKISPSVAQRYIDLLAKHFVGQITDTTFTAMGAHIATLQAMARQAQDNLESAEHQGAKIQWFRARLEALRDIAKIMGFERAGASLVFERGDERFIIHTGGVQDLLTLRDSMRNKPVNGYAQAYEETRHDLEKGG